MKKLFSIITLAATLVVTTPVKAQIIGVPDTNVTVTAITDVFSFMSHAGTNLFVTAYGLYDLTTKTGGAGVAGEYLITPNLGAVLRLDYLNRDVLMPQGNVQLQIPISVGKMILTPFTFAGAGTSLGGKGVKNGDIVYVASLGAALRVTSHLDILAAYERWTGGGFNDNVVAIGAGWKF